VEDSESVGRDYRPGTLEGWEKPGGH
jgi:hypothetical protein